MAFLLLHNYMYFIKIDVKTIFDRLKGVFGMRGTHVRGK